MVLDYRAKNKDKRTKTEGCGFADIGDNEDKKEMYN